jgi:membrane protein involved in colicin uptake
VELKAKQEADAKAAVELKAKQEADAKAAVELKAKQEAEAKTALGKAQSELAAANAALLDSQKVNREQALKIISLEEQFKVSSESIGDLQSQISQLNNKLALAIKGQTSVNAKIKKICSVKPKPKGC